MHSSIRKLGALALLCLTAFGAASLQAQMVTNYPVEAPSALRNPLMGFASGRDSQHPYPTVFKQYIRWNQIENNTNDTVQKIRDFCNAQWANLPTNNIKVIPRVYIDWDSATNNEAWPADLTPGDWSSQAFKDRVVRLVGRLGEVWDNDPRVAWVQTGIIGYWGEQESPVGISQDGWAQRLGTAFTNAFHNKKLVVRNMGDWPGYTMGVYWDSFGHPGQRPWAWKSIQDFNNQGRYLTQLVEGEVAYNWGESSFDPLYGGEPTITLGNTNYTDNMIDVIRELHCSALTWIAGYKVDGSDGTDPNTVRANAARMQKEFGYRFRLTEFVSSARTEPGANLNVRFKVKNQGSAPLYENWPVAVVLINETTRQIVWKATLPNVDIRTWRPGHNYSYTTRTYQTPAQEHQVAALVPIPAGMAAGQYLVGLSILEPNSRTPGVFFAVTNYFKQSQSQPLARIGIGMNASSHTLTGVAFDDLVNDDKRYYTMTAQGPTNTLTVQSSSRGTITATPGGTNFVKDTGVQVTAVANPGYLFASWGGALTGLANNPAIVVMDTSKSISANYVPLSDAVTLTTSAANGSISLNPPGGIYTTGTVVTVTALPNAAYAFTNWSGDLTGSVNPTNITMTGNQSVTANFALLPTYTLTPNAANGSITLNPPGGIYSSGMVVTVTAIANNGYQFDSWSGALSGSANPTPITMNTNQSVTANFAVFTGEAVPWLETFTFPDGTKTDGPPTSWTATRAAGVFEVRTNVVDINNSGGEGVLETGEIGIAGGSVRASIEVRGQGGLDGSGGSLDYVRFYKIVDGGSPVLIGPEILGAVTGTQTLLGTSITGGKLKLRIETLVTATDEHYFFDNLKVERESATTNYTLAANAINGTITLNPPGGVYNAGTVVTVTAIPSSGYSFTNWSGNLTGSNNPATLTMNGNKSVTANFIMPQPGYPYSFTYNGNPLVRNHGAADPDVHVWDGVVWLYCSQDHAPNYDNMDGYHAFSSTNLIDWVDHGEILHSRDISWGTNGFMWAPGAARANGQYYLYYPHKDKAGSWKIGVATSPVPQGPFTDIGAPMAGIGGIDPAIFIDDDGQAYIYNNNHIVAKLKPNMIELAEATRSINYGPQAVTTNTYLQFNEGSYMHKRNGVYYYSYSNFKNNTNQAFYGMATNPYGPFEWKGPMAVAPTGVQDHHSVMEFQGQWYYFYHVALLNIPAVKDGQSRIACFDKMYYNPDGTIQVVNMTLGPVGGTATNFQVNCGGSAVTAGDGTVFEADGTYNYGGSGFSTSSAISGTTDDALYQTERFGGSFNYSFPLVNGDYDVTLMFAEINFNTAGSRVFHVALEGTQVITNLDIWAKVGKNAAYNETHRVTVSDGQLNIAFTTVVNNAKISALKVQRIQAPTVPIWVQPPVLQGGQLRLEWGGGGTLQTATNVAGPWNDVTNALAPYLQPTTNPAQFFRVKQ